MKNILFFSRKNDDLSKKCSSHLQNLGFDVTNVLSSRRGEKIPDDLGILKPDYIFCYRSYFILPEYLIHLPKFSSINFHPGPPSHPGSGGINFALYNNEEFFGTTIHLMDKLVDSGRIIDTKEFPIFKNDTVETLLKRTHEHLFSSFVEFTTQLNIIGPSYIEKRMNNSKEVKWGGNKKQAQDIDDFSLIQCSITKEELNKRIRSFHCSDFPLEIEIHNKRFFLKDSE